MPEFFSGWASLMSKPMKKLDNNTNKSDWIDFRGLPEGLLPLSIF